jgi:ribosomal protein L11 methyltransferase
VPQSRLFLILPRAEAERAYLALEAAFEIDGCPIGVTETDEARGLQTVELYVETDAVEAMAQRAGDALRAAGFTETLQRDDLPDIDWVSESLKGLAPVRAGRFLVHGSHDRRRRQPGDVAIEIEAGLAFGTGHHGTTSGCLQTIDRVLRARSPRNALDLGTGSAVLAIAIAKAAHLRVLATDIDAVATRVARDNVRLNGVSSLVTTHTAPGLADPVFRQYGPFDLVVANILAGPLIKLAPAMAPMLSGGGSLILSGILERQRNHVLAAYVGQRFRHRRTLLRDGWATILFER